MFLNLVNKYVCSQIGLLTLNVRKSPVCLVIPDTYTAMDFSFFFRKCPPCLLYQTLESPFSMYICNPVQPHHSFQDVSQGAMGPRSCRHSSSH